MYVDRKVRIEHRDFFDTVASDEISDFAYNAISREGVEATLVEDHVGAVVAGVGQPTLVA